MGVMDAVRYGIQKVYALGNPEVGHDLAELRDGEIWPDRDGANRVAGYERFTRIYLGDHEAVFEPGRDDDSEGQYYAMNLSSRVTRLLAARLTGQPPRPHPKTEGQQELTPEQQAQVDVLDAILRASKWGELIDRAVQGHSYRGDSVLKAVYDAETDMVKLKSIQPSRYWPEMDEEDTDKVRAVSIVWQVRPEDPKDKAIYFREERHTPGLIENKLWKAVEVRDQNGQEGQYLRKEVPLNTLSRFAELEESIDTKIDAIPVVLVPNLPIDETEPWGISDYAQPDDLQAGTNRSISRAWNIADMHEELPFAVDESRLDDFGNYDHSMKVVPLIQHEPAPQYVPYPSDASQSMEQAQEMMLWFCLVSGVSPESLGLGSAAPAESGYAIRLRQMLTTSTTEKKRVLWDDGLTYILSAAMKLHQVHVTEGPKAIPLLPEEIEIEWSDGLPEDQMAEVQKASTIKTSGLPVPDLELVRMIFPDRSDADLQAMLDQYAAESQAAIQQSMEAMYGLEGGSPEIGEGELEETVAAQEARAG